jgi:hypothetical protein
MNVLLMGGIRKTTKKKKFETVEKLSSRTRMRDPEKMKCPWLLDSRFPFTPYLIRGGNDNFTYFFLFLQSQLTTFNWQLIFAPVTHRTNPAAAGWYGAGSWIYLPAESPK